MYICSCNPFSDRSVRTYLQQEADKAVSVKDVYQACSGGQNPNCCSCIPHLKTMVSDHNNGVTVGKLKESLPGAAAPAMAIPDQSVA